MIAIPCWTSTIVFPRCGIAAWLFVVMFDNSHRLCQNAWRCSHLIKFEPFGLRNYFRVMTPMRHVFCRPVHLVQLDVLCLQPRFVGLQACAVRGAGSGQAPKAPETAKIAFLRPTAFFRHLAWTGNAWLCFWCDFRVPSPSAWRCCSPEGAAGHTACTMICLQRRRCSQPDLPWGPRSMAEATHRQWSPVARAKHPTDPARRGGPRRSRSLPASTPPGRLGRWAGGQAGRRAR